MEDALATIGQLVRAVAVVQGVDEVSVGVVARKAREAGHIAQGGRGRSAPKMTARDAANLLIGVNAATVGREVATTIEAFRELPQLIQFTTGDLSRYGVMSSITNKGLQFGEALEAMIKGASEGEKPPTLAGGMEATFLGADLDWARSELKTSSADLKLHFIRPRRAVDVGIDSDEGAALRIRFQGSGGTRDGGDQRVTTSITHRTIFAVANAISQ